MKIFVKLTPNSKKSEIFSDEIDLFGARVLKARVNAIPVNGKANEALIDLLADYFLVKKSAIKLIYGFTSRNKIIEIKNF